MHMKKPLLDKKHECTIILDTNQFVRDLTLSEIRWKNLADYIEKTDARIKMPRLVWDELQVNYKKKIDEQLRRAQQNADQYNKLIGFTSEHHHYNGHLHRISLPKRELDTDELMERYLAFVKTKLKLRKYDFLEIDQKWYQEIYQRSLVHKKPFSDESDKGFKDSILWKTVLSLSKRPGFDEAPVVFISANTKDFCDDKNGKELHPELRTEAEENGLDVYFFDGLDKFFQEWSAAALDIDFNKIKKSIPSKLINAALSPYVAKLMRRGEKTDENIHVTGMNFKINSVDGKSKELEMSISGYLTNTSAQCPYLDFSAEARFQDNESNKTITIKNFSPEKIMPATARAELPSLLSRLE